MYTSERPDGSISSIFTSLPGFFVFDPLIFGYALSLLLPENMELVFPVLYEFTLKFGLALKPDIFPCLGTLNRPINPSGDPPSEEYLRLLDDFAIRGFLYISNIY